MLPLPQTAEYALRAVCYVAEHESAGPIPGPALARALDAPANYLSKLLHQLGQLGVLTSTRGAQGGYRLGLPADQLYLASIVGPFLPEMGNRCIMGREHCRNEAPCGAHERWKAVRATTTAFFEGLTMADLLKGATTTSNTPPGPASADR